MTIAESLQGLTRETQLLIILLLALWAASEVRHWLRHRADQRTIQQLQAPELWENRATLETQRVPGEPRGAALTLGDVVHRGASAGQPFVAVLQNVGPHGATDINVRARLGGHLAETVDAPENLPPDSAPEPLQVVLPFGFESHADVMAAMAAGEVLRVQIAFTDGTATRRSFEECFAFEPEPASQSAGAHAWVSRRVPCPALA
jgi:hypothetical protein